MIVQGLTESFRKGLLEGKHDFINDIFKMALYTAAANLSGTTSQYTASGELVAGGYTAGGLTLVNIHPAIYSGEAVTSFASPSWPGSAFSGVVAALIYNTSKADASVAVLNFGTPRSSKSDGVFTVNLEPVGMKSGLIRISQ